MIYNVSGLFNAKDHSVLVPFVLIENDSLLSAKRLRQADSSSVHSAILHDLFHSRLDVKVP